MNDSEFDKKICFIPTVEYFLSTYGGSSTENDKKATRVFRDYESQEKLRRLQSELIQIKEGKVSHSVCDRVLGKKRSTRYESYENWGKLMLMWIAER